MQSENNSSEPLTPRSQPGRIPTQAEFNALVDKNHKTGNLTEQERALLDAYHDMRAQQFLQALKDGVREGLPTP